MMMRFRPSWKEFICILVSVFYQTTITSTIILLMKKKKQSRVKYNERLQSKENEWIVKRILLYATSRDDATNGKM